jgi:hypothetical protein
MFSPFNTILFAATKTGHESEDRFSARMSCISALVQSNITASNQIAMYGEFDFLGAAQSANSNESNSFTPRIRNLYATVDWERLRLAPAGRSVLVAGDHEFQRRPVPR